MDYSTLIHEVLKLWWLLPLILILGILRMPLFKGMFGEVLVKLVARLGLPADTYYAVHNVTLPTPDGTTQIDHIYISQYGIFVIVTKNMKGWIFGGENQAQWTQKIYKKSFKFQNPLRQNYKHLKALEAVLDVSPDTIYSVIVFIGDNKFKKLCRQTLPKVVAMLGISNRFENQ